MSYLLFFFYLFIFCWCISRIKFFKDSGLSIRLITGLFLVRVIAGILSTYINFNYYPVTDASIFRDQGVEEYNLLFHNTAEYFTNIFRSNHNNSYSGFMESSGSYWNDTRSNIIVKMLSIFNIFTGKNFYINTLLYNFLIFFGAVALYKVFIKVFPSYSYTLIACIFLLPSAVYYTSGIHRDGLIFLALSLLIYHLTLMLRNKQLSWKRVLLSLFFLLLILLLRNFVFIILVPAITAWIIAERNPRHAFPVFAGIYILVGILFFCSGFFSPNTDLPRYTCQRQLAFIELAKNGASAIDIKPLYPNFRSFLNNTPQALNHSLMRPYLTEHRNFFYIPAAVEILLYEVLFVLFIFFRRKNIQPPPLVYFSCFVGLTMFLVIGYTIPIIGAIVRYRSIYFTWVLIPVACYTDWGKLKKYFHI